MRIGLDVTGGIRPDSLMVGVPRCVASASSRSPRAHPSPADLATIAVRGISTLAAGLGGAVFRAFI